MKLTPAFFTKIGEALFGPSWRKPLATSINVAERTVRRWQVSGAAIPDGVGPDLAVLCRARASSLVEIAEKIEGAK